MNGPVLVGVDDSEDAVGAVREAAQIARGQKVDLVVVHVIDVPSALMGLSAAGAAAINATAGDIAAETRSKVDRALAGTDTAWKWVQRPGSAANEILAEAATSQAALIVVGSRGSSRFGHLGSVAIKLVHHSPTSVLVVRN